MSPAPLFSGRAELSTAASVSSILEYANSWQCVCLLVLDLPLGGRSPTQLRSPICSLSENTCYPPTVRHPPPIPLQRISSAARLFRGSLDEMGTAAVGGRMGEGEWRGGSGGTSDGEVWHALRRLVFIAARLGKLSVSISFSISEGCGVSVTSLPALSVVTGKEPSSRSSGGPLLCSSHRLGN